MGAGKSSVGRALGQRLNWAFEDLDDCIERREGRTVAEIFRDSGEAAFRRAEHLALRHTLADASRPTIIALGGGAFAQENNLLVLSACAAPIVFLDAPVDELWQRCSKQAAEAGTIRPLLGSPEQFRQLYEARRCSYERASIRIQTCDHSVDAIATQIVEKLSLRKIEIRTEQGEVE